MSKALKKPLKSTREILSHALQLVLNPRCKKTSTGIVFSSFCYSDAKLGNSLPRDIRFCDLLSLFKTKLTLTSTRHPRVRHTRNIKLGLGYPLWRLKFEFRTSLKGMMTIPFLLRKVWLMKEYLASRQA